MFISKGKTAFSSFIGLVLCLIGGSTAAFWLLGVILSITGEIEATNSRIGDALMSLAIALIGVLITYFGVSKIRLVNKTKMLDNIFRGDFDGEITVNKTAVLMGMSDADFIKLFKKLIAKGYLVNASLNNENGNFRIVLNGGKTQNVEYVVVKCDGCGGSNSVRKGFVGKCTFCGNDIKG